jgi:hypothetical protein
MVPQKLEIGPKLPQRVEGAVLLQLSGLRVRNDFGLL